MDEQKKYCQSCGMPLGGVGMHGTNLDGSSHQDFCKFCFQQGKFVDPAITLPQMIENSVSYMTKGLKMDEVKAREVSLLLIPRLKRWTSS